MIQALFQTISSFFIDMPSVANLMNDVGSGETNLLGGIVSLIAGLFGKKDA